MNFPKQSVFCTVVLLFFFIMYFGYLLHPPPPLRELARPAEWGFVYMVVTGQKKVVLLLPL
jgi:hypothetical protein